MDSSTTRLNGGLGLGLAIVRQLVEAHGGTVTAGSAGLGRGSTFTVTFPIRAVSTLRGDDGEAEHERENADPRRPSSGLDLAGAGGLVGRLRVSKALQGKQLVQRRSGLVGIGAMDRSAAAH